MTDLQFQIIHDNRQDYKILQGSRKGTLHKLAESLFLCSFVNRKIHCKRSNCTLIPCLVLPNTIVGVLAVGLHSWVAVRCGRNKQPRQNQTGYKYRSRRESKEARISLKDVVRTFAVV